MSKFFLFFELFEFVLVKRKFSTELAKPFFSVTEVLELEGESKL